MSSTPKLYYFDIPGKAEAARLACQYGRFPVEDIRLDRDQFNAMKEAGTLPYGQVRDYCIVCNYSLRYAMLC
jgi:hypothetical protein